MALTTDLNHDTKDTLKRDLGLTNEQYNTIYYDVEIKMSTRGLLGQPLRSLTSKAQIRQISNEISNEFPSVFLGLPENLRTKYVKQLAQRCSHNATRRTNKTAPTRQITTGNPVLPHSAIAHYPLAGIPKAIRQEGTPRSYGTTTILIRRAADEEPIIIPTRKLATGKNNALDIHVDDLSFDTFVDMLGQDIDFDPKSETLCYYVGDKIAGGRIQLVNEEKWRSAVEDMFLQEMDRFSFIIEQRRTICAASQERCNHSPSISAPLPSLDNSHSTRTRTVRTGKRVNTKAILDPQLSQKTSPSQKRALTLRLNPQQKRQRKL